MTVTVTDVLIALVWGAVGAVALWLLTWWLRRRSTTGLLLSLTLTCTAASAGAMLGAVHAMVLPMGDETVVLVLAGGAGALAAVAAVLAARRVGREHGAVATAIDQLGYGTVPDLSGPRLGRDLEQLRSQLHRTAAELHDSRDRERALEHARRELVAWVSHDLRTPLAGLRAMAEALEDGVPEDPETYYKQIATTVDRLSGLVDDLFDLSRIQAGALGQLTEPLCAEALASDVVVALQPLAAAKGVDLVVRSSGPLTVRGNAAELSRAMTNVVANGVRHTPGGGRVTVDLDRVDDLVTMSVSDCCGGIDDDALPRLFDVGFRGDAARTPDGRGGLGLAIAKGIVDAHHGTVSVANTGIGCCFRITLPVVPTP